jgi:hypothetical protein
MDFVVDTVTGLENRCDLNSWSDYMDLHRMEKWKSESGDAVRISFAADSR